MVEPALDDGQLRRLRGVLADLRIAPLGRNYWERFRDIRAAIEALQERDEGGVDAATLAAGLDADDLDFLRAVAEGLRTMAEDGFRRQGRVEPYVSAEADAARLEPFLDLLAPHAG